MHSDPSRVQLETFIDEVTLRQSEVTLINLKKVKALMKKRDF